MARPRRRPWALRGCALAACALAAAALPLSKPIREDGDVPSAGNKFLRRTATRDGRAPGSGVEDEEPDLLRGSCPAGVSLRWAAEVSSSVYSAPLIADVYGEGTKQVVVPTFVHYLESLEGADGAKTEGFPAFHASMVHTSPFMHDVDGDGVPDVGLATYDGEIIFHSAKGALLPQKLVIPKLAVHKDWHVGLAADPLDHKHPDVGDAPREKEAAGGARRRRLLQAEDAGAGADAAGGNGSDDAALDEFATSDAAAAAAFERFREDDEAWDAGEQDGGGFPYDDVGAEADAFDPNQAAGGAGAIRPPREYAHEHAYDDVASRATGAAAADADDEGMAIKTAQQRQWELGETERGMDYHDSDYGWGSQEWEAADADGGAWADGDGAKEGMLLVDAHVLCSPTLADVDGDGSPELLVAVSYFFDKEHYATASARAHLPAEVVLSNYLATGLAVFDLGRMALKWHVHLDLSTDAASYKAYAYSPPVAADADGDGQLEVFVGTSVGFVYAFAPSGALRSGFPLQMGEVQAGVTLTDLDGDGRLELLAADTRGNVAAFDAATGEERWERHLASMAAQSATFADVDGDGQLDVILPTADGRVHALRGDTGADVPHFPFATRGRVLAPVTPVPATPGAGASMPRLTLIVASFDGFVYFVDASTGCADPVDVGETIYGAPLVDDIDGDGRSEVVVATMNGNVLCLATPWRHHALMAWPAATPGGNNAAARGGAVAAGVHVGAGTRRANELSGDTFSIQFTVQDGRPGAAKAAARVATRRQLIAAAAASAAGGGKSAAAAPPLGPYEVTVMLRIPGSAPEVSAAAYAAPGTYSLALPVPRSRGRGLVTVRLRDAFGIVSEDAYPVTFHARYYRLLKWLLVGPFTAMAVALAAGLDDAGPGALAGVAATAPWGARAAQD